MKKILIIGVIILSVFIIYLTTLDKKVYYLVLGDEISLGMVEEGYYQKGYADYIKEYLEEKNKLDIYIPDYATNNYQITDVINDINNNKEIEETNKTIKNALIKADLITISIGNNDILQKISNEKKLTKIDYKKLKNNIDTILEDMDKMQQLIREYSKEDIIQIGIYINNEDEKIDELIHYANEKAKTISNKNKIAYIDLYEILNTNKTPKIYPTEKEYKLISEATINIINNNLLNN